MKNLKILSAFLLLSVFLAICPGISLAQESEPQTAQFFYRPGPGDVLSIRVWRHPDLDTTVSVRSDCGISFPLVNQVNACDLTIDELRDHLKTNLAETIRDPRVTINVESFQSQKILVLGEVVRPGIFQYNGGMTALEVIARAGGYDRETAVLKSVMIIRRGTDGQHEAIRINLSKAIHEAALEENIVLQANDIVFVPKSFIAKVNQFINQFFTKTSPLLQYYLDIIDIDQRTPSGRLR